MNIATRCSHCNEKIGLQYELMGVMVHGEAHGPQWRLVGQYPHQDCLRRLREQSEALVVKQRV